MGDIIITEFKFENGQRLRRTEKMVPAQKWRFSYSENNIHARGVTIFYPYYKKPAPDGITQRWQEKKNRAKN